MPADKLKDTQTALRWVTIVLLAIVAVLLGLWLSRCLDQDPNRLDPIDKLIISLGPNIVVNLAVVVIALLFWKKLANLLSPDEDYNAELVATKVIERLNAVRSQGTQSVSDSEMDSQFSKPTVLVDDINDSITGVKKDIDITRPSRPIRRRPSPKNK